MIPEDTDFKQLETDYIREMVDNKATWQAECAAGVWFYYPTLPLEGMPVLLSQGNGEDPWIAVREDDEYVFGQGREYKMRVKSVWAWAYIQTPRKG